MSLSGLPTSQQLTSRFAREARNADLTIGAEHCGNPADTMEDDETRRIELALEFTKHARTIRGGHAA